jgi:uncharacterized protein (DUF433 family)
MIEETTDMSRTATIWQYLAPKPKSNYRQLFVKGRNIAARTLYSMYVADEEPMTVQEIAEDYDLALEVVEEAIRYCESDPPEIREDFEREERLMEALGMNDPDYKYHGKPKSLTLEERARIWQS